MKKYEYDVDVVITYMKTITVEAFDHDQAECLAYTEIKREHKGDCEIDIRCVFESGVVEDDRRRCEVRD
jgi:hypothetical protein